MPAFNSSSAAPGRTLLRARIVLPIVRPPIRDGAVVIRNGRIEQVGSWRALASEPCQTKIDLGEVILTPGLINAHCHLDYTDMAGQLTAGRSFSHWIKGMLALKAHWTYSDYAASWLKGARMLLQRGVTTVADIEAVPELLPDVRLATPLRLCSLLEMTGVRGRRVPAEILQRAIDKIATLPPAAAWTGLSPHAPYSTPPELLRLSAEAARLRGWLVATHVGESAEEFEMYTAGRGPMFKWLHPQRDMDDCGRGSPVQHLHRQDLLGENLLAIHANYLAPGDVDLLAQTKTNVVHCPRSHVYFGHERFPYQALAERGVNVCLGTDSLATVRTRGRKLPELDLFAEIRALADAEPGLEPETLVRLVTVNGARALRRVGQLGELSAGALADLITIPFPGGRRVYDGVVGHDGPVKGVMINGQWIVKPHECTGL
jgi:cytosine/adenosine deaminase-related metal-dependent hydrolase